MLSELQLVRDGQGILLCDWAQFILDKMQEINETFFFGLDDILEQKRHQILNPNETISAKIVELVSTNDYIKMNLQLAKVHKENVLHQPFSLAGFEDLDVATQSLIKEVIKQGISMDSLSDLNNFTSLKKNKHEAFIEQANNNLFESYSTMLAMETGDRE